MAGQTLCISTAFWNNTTRLSQAQLVATIVVGFIALGLAGYLGKKQIKLMDKQMKLSAIQVEINGISFELNRKEQQRINAQNAFLALSLDKDIKDRAKFYQESLDSIKHFTISSDKLVKELNEQYKKYEEEAKKSIN